MLFTLKLISFLCWRTSRATWGPQQRQTPPGRPAVLRRGKFHSGHLKTPAAAGKNTGHVRLSLRRGEQRAGQVKDAQLSRVPVGLQQNQSDVISICHVQTVTRPKQVLPLGSISAQWFGKRLVLYGLQCSSRAGTDGGENTRWRNSHWGWHSVPTLTHPCFMFSKQQTLQK